MFRGSVRRVSRYAVAALIVLSTGLVARSVHGDVLKVAPTDSLGVLKVKSLSGMSKKLADLSAKLGVAAFNPDLADPLGSMKEKGGLKNGLKDDGEFGVVLLPAAAWPKDMEAEGVKPAIVLLFAVTDYSAFLTNFEGAKTDGAVSEVQFGGETNFVAQWGDYAAVSPGKDFVTMKGEGVKLNPAAAKELDSKDGGLWANIPAMKSVFSPQLAANKDKWLAQVEEEIKGNAETAKYAPAAKALVSQMILAADTFLSDAQGATISLNITDAGMDYSVAAEFGAESYLGKVTSGLKGESSSFTQGIPAGSYLVFGGAAVNGEAVAGLLTDLAGPVMKEVVALEGGADSQKAMDAMIATTKSTKVTTFAMLAPRGALGTESLIQAGYWVKGDSKTFVEAMRLYTESYGKVMSGAGGTAMMPFTIDFKPDARELDGVKFDVMTMSTNPNPKTPEEAQMAQMMGMMYGPGGLTYATGALNDTTAVIAMGMPDATLSKFIAAGKAGSDDLGAMANVQSTTKQLPGTPAVVMYVALDEFIRTGATYARQFGLPVNLQLPDNLPPIGVGVGTEANTLRVDTHVPTELVQSIVAAFIQMQMQQGGGGGL